MLRRQLSRTTPGPGDGASLRLAADTLDRQGRWLCPLMAMDTINRALRRQGRKPPPTALKGRLEICPAKATGKADEKIAQDEDFLASIGGGHCQPERAPCDLA